MFNKDKVKSHNRLVKSKKGFQVTIIKDFFRKKNEDRNRNLGVGLGATAVIGLGAAILLKKKGINLKSVIPKKKTNDMVVKVDVDNLNLTPRPGDGNSFSKEALEKFKKPTSPPTTKVKEVVEDIKPASPKVVDEVPNKKPSTESVVSPKKKFDSLPDPWTTPIPSKSGVRGSTMVVKKPVTQNRIRRKDNIPDPWETPIKTKINSSDMVVPKTKEEVVQLLLPAKKKIENRPRIRRSQDNYLLEDLIQNPRTKPKAGVIIPVIETDQIQQGLRDYKNIYSPLPVGMKANLQIEKALRNPTRRSNLGRPPESTSLKVILDDSNKKSTESIVRKVKSRLKRESDIALDDIVPSASRRKLVGVDKVKQVVTERDKIADVTVATIAERKSPMGLAISRINKLARDPEAERLGIEVRTEEWEKALQAISGRRGATKAIGRGLARGSEAAIYARVVKPKIIKELMGELKSGNLKSTNPKGYSERLRRVHDNFDELMTKEGVDYRKLSRRELAKRVGRVMEPEIQDATKKAKDFATNTRTLTDTFLENSQMQEAFGRAGIKDPKAQFVMKMLMKIGGM